jgi:glycosyltransferase involved in cell wall biosynthesis
MLKNVKIIGPSVDRTRGGMATVIQGFIDSNAENYGYRVEHYTSHVEGGSVEKLTVFFKCFFKLLFAGNVSLVHIHTACDASFYRKAILALVCRLKGIPVVMHIHGADFDSFYLNANTITQGFIRSSLKHCNRVIVLSAYWQKFFEENLALDNVVVLFNAVNHTVFSEGITTPRNINSFLFLGRLGERKGIYDLVKAIDVLVNQQDNKQLKFYLAGDGEVEEVRELVTKLNLLNQVEILGWVGDKQKLDVLLKADTVVLPSYNEGLPVALLEAMAAGKVILSTPVGGIPDLVSEGSNGFLIAPGDVDALVVKIKHIYQNPAEMMVIAKNNIEKITSQYSSTQINQQLYNLYDQILTGSNPTTATSHY